MRVERLTRKLETGSNKGRAAILGQLVPYPAYIEHTDSRVSVRFPDFDDLHVAGPCMDTAIQKAQDALLRHIIVLMREGKSIPALDNYIQSIDEGRILRLDPLGTYEGQSS